MYVSHNIVWVYIKRLCFEFNLQPLNFFFLGQLQPLILKQIPLLSMGKKNDTLAACAPSGPFPIHHAYYIKNNNIWLL